MADEAPPERNRQDAVHRVRVGLTGLACVFLIVMLATALLRASEERGGTRAAAANAAAPSEPLAELGVAPGNGPAPHPGAAAPGQATH